MAFLNLIIGAVLFALANLLPDGDDGGSSGGSGNAPATSSGAGSTNDSGQQTGQQQTPAAPQPKADGADADDDDGDGRGSKRAILGDLAREREKRHEAETELSELRAFRDQHKSDAEKERDAAVKSARDEEASRWSNGARAAAWRAALAKLGVSDADAIAIPPAVSKLKVDPDTFQVDGLDAVVTDFHKQHPSLFVATTAGGSADQGPRGSAPRKPATLEEAVNRQLAGQGAKS